MARVITKSSGSTSGAGAGIAQISELRRFAPQLTYLVLCLNKNSDRYKIEIFPIIQKSLDTRELLLSF